MFRLVTVSCILIVAVRAVPHETIAKIFADMDYNENDVINANEIKAYFELFKNNPHEEHILKSKFVQVWTHKYPPDTTAMAEHLYSRFDANGDGLLSDSDIAIIFFQLDKNHNGIEWAEFEKALNAWYGEI